MYVLVSFCGKRTYVGITTDVERRLSQHNGERSGGAKFTREFRPWKVGAVFGPYDSNGEAQSVEHAVKKLSGRERLQFSRSPHFDSK